MEILLILPSFILAIIIIVMWKIKLKKPRNNVHFYIVRDKSYNILWLYLGKPIRFNNEVWLPGKHGTVITTEEFSFESLGLNKEDYDNLKWEDEPVEVFLNLNN